MSVLIGQLIVIVLVVLTIGVILLVTGLLNPGLERRGTEKQRYSFATNGTIQVPFHKYGRNGTKPYQFKEVDGTIVVADYILEVTDQENKESKTYEVPNHFSKGLFTIGREACDISTNISTMSYCHGRLYHTQNGKLMFCENAAGTTNGTYDEHQRRVNELVIEENHPFYLGGARCVLKKKEMNKEGRNYEYDDDETFFFKFF